MVEFFSQALTQIQHVLFQTYQVALTHTMVNLSTIVLLGVAAQWLAWYFHFPSILLLLFLGFLAGPGIGLINPDQLLGNLLTPFVSLSVAIILFEGGLNLKVSDLRRIGRPVRGLISIGVLATWTFSTFLAHLLLPIKFELCLLFGAILTVTGPTVIIPMIRQIKPDPKIASILRWEGILIDPVGATLAVIVFELVLIGTFRNVPQTMLFDLGKILLCGMVTGGAGAGILYVLFKYHLAPEFLHNPLSLAMVLSVFSFSNQIQNESGLFAVTLAGILLGYQKSVSVRHILQFKENLQVLLISTLFILLAARLKMEDVKFIDLRVIAFTFSLIFIVRPLSVFLSTMNSDLTRREKIFLSFLAPRGIVAASITSIFSMKLFQAGHLKAPLLVPYMFAVIVITVLFYGLTAGFFARYLGVSQKNPQGTVILGAHDWARDMAKVLQSYGIPVLLIDRNPQNVCVALSSGLLAIEKSILSEDVSEEIEINSYKRLLCLTSNDTVNSLAQVRFREFFEPQDIFQLPLQNQKAIPSYLCGRFLFGPDVSFLELYRRFNQGGVVTAVTKADWATQETLRTIDGKPLLIPLAMIDDKAVLHVFSLDSASNLDQAKTIFALTSPAPMGTSEAASV